MKLFTVTVTAIYLTFFLTNTGIFDQSDKASIILRH